MLHHMMEVEGLSFFAYWISGACCLVGVGWWRGWVMHMVVRWKYRRAMNGLLASCINLKYHVINVQPSRRVCADTHTRRSQNSVCDASVAGGGGGGGHEHSLPRHGHTEHSLTFLPIQYTPLLCGIFRRVDLPSPLGLPHKTWCLISIPCLHISPSLLWCHAMLGTSVFWALSSGAHGWSALSATCAWWCVSASVAIVCGNDVVHSGSFM